MDWGASIVGTMARSRLFAMFSMLVLMMGWVVAGCEFSSAPDPSENIVLIVVDTLRADRMSLYGHKRKTTPFLDSIASDLQIYERTQAVAPWTVPSHASLLTGLPPSEHRAQWGHPIYTDPRPTLAELLRDRGFQTIGLSSNHFVSKKQGFARGFDLFELYKEQDLQRTKSILKRLKELLLDREDKRLFLFVNLMDTHIPYMTGKYANAFGGKESGPIVTPRQKWEVSAGLKTLRGGRKRAHEAAYDASIRHTDDSLAAIYELLDQHAMLDDTLIIITSDHGDGLGAHQELGHSISVWEEQLAIPLVVRHPGLSGQRITRRVSQLSIVPSILDWLGLDRPEHLRTASALDAADVLITSDYRNYFGEKERGTNQQMGRRYPQLAEAIQNMHVIYCEDHKLIAGADGSRLHFDLSSDPHEQKPLNVDGAAALACEQRYLAALHQGRFTAFDLKLSDEELERAEAAYDEESLRALGYIE